MESHGSDRWIVDGIEAARALLDARGVEVWQTSPLPGTGGGVNGSSVVRFHSPTRTAIAKLVRRNEVAPNHPRWWRRELEVYESAWLRERLPVGLGLPDCLGSTTTRDADVMILSEVPFDDRTRRSSAWYGDLAVELGRLNGASLADSPSWATLGFVASEATDAASLIPGTLADPNVWIADLLDDWRTLLARIADAAGELIELLDTLPDGFHHLDAFSRNAARVGENFVLIDWAYAGVAPIGCDAAALISITAMHGDVPDDRLDVLHEVVIDGYARGLASVGGVLPSESLRRAIDVALTLRFARFLTQANGAGDELPAIAGLVSERPWDEIRPRWVTMAEHLRAGAERSLSLVGR